MLGINEVDVGMVVDSTGSMGGLISEAQKNLVSLVTQLSKKANINSRYGVAEYRDHPQGETTKDFVARSYPFTDDAKIVQQNIMSLRPSGGGDEAEAVFDGIIEITNLEWRKHARRIALLIGDAPPHGEGCRDDKFPKGCPCGATMQSATAALEGKGITAYTIALTAHAAEAFATVANYTGGRAFSANAGAAIQTIQDILNLEFANVEFDKQVLERHLKGEEVEVIVESLGSNRVSVVAALSRLGSRGFLEAHQE